MFPKTLGVLMAVFFGTLGTLLLLQKQFQVGAGDFGCAILWIYYLVINRSERKVAESLERRDRNERVMRKNETILLRAVSGYGWLLDSTKSKAAETHAVHSSTPRCTRNEGRNHKESAGVGGGVSRVVVRKRNLILEVVQSGKLNITTGLG